MSAYRLDGADGYLNRRPTVSTATIENTSNIPIAIIGMPTTYSAVAPNARRRKLGRAALAFKRVRLPLYA